MNHSKYDPMTPKQFAACFRLMRIQPNTVAFFDARAIDVTDMVGVLNSPHCDFVPKSVVFIPVVPRCEHTNLQDTILELNEEQLKEMGLRRLNDQER